VSSEVRNLFAVKDTGIGIAQEQIKHLFKSFSQIDSAISRRYGAQGLSCHCKQLTEIMGGRIGSRVKRVLAPPFISRWLSQFHPIDTPKVESYKRYLDSLNSYPYGFC